LCACDRREREKGTERKEKKRRRRREGVPGGLRGTGGCVGPCRTGRGKTGEGLGPLLFVTVREEGEKKREKKKEEEKGLGEEKRKRRKGSKRREREGGGITGWGRKRKGKEWIRWPCVTL
jgi:hypothetical protein